MKKILLTTFIVLISFNGFSQFKTIVGTVINSSTHNRIVDVTINPPFLDSTYTSNKNGKFRILMPNSYLDTLVFTHPEYYPFVKKINRGSKLKLHHVMLTPLSVQIDTVFHSAYEENRLLTGSVYDVYRGEPIENASVSLGDKKVFAYSDKDGKFAAGIPSYTDSIIVTHPEFETRKVRIRKGKKYLRHVDIEPVRISFECKDTLWKSYKNLVEIVPSDVISNAIGFSYQRFLNEKFAIGLKASLYVLNKKRLNFYGSDNDYSGYKLAPYFRYYEMRNMKKSNFIEFRLLAGYFDFDKLRYYWKVDRRDGEYTSAQFWSYGFAGVLGRSLVISKNTHFTFSYSVGIQVFPLNAPGTMQSDNYGTLYVENWWWYIAGPGSVIHVTIAFGGIF